jgi:hypothetical protein
MKTFLFIAVALVAINILTLCSSNAQVLNPYAPTNAVAAEPMEPYNLWLIPDCSRTHYVPCPTCYYPFSAGLPDVPIQWTVRGYLGICVPVP